MYFDNDKRATIQTNCELCEIKAYMKNPIRKNANEKVQFFWLRHPRKVIALFETTRFLRWKPRMYGTVSSSPASLYRQFYNCHKHIGGQEINRPSAFTTSYPNSCRSLCQTLGGISLTNYPIQVCTVKKNFQRSLRFKKLIVIHIERFRWRNSYIIVNALDWISSRQRMLSQSTSVMVRNCRSAWKRL